MNTNSENIAELFALMKITMKAWKKGQDWLEAYYFTE